MATYLDNIDVLEKEFDDLAIPIASPGFYDHPKFVQKEKQQDDYLNLYASFVNKRTFDSEYLSHAREIIPRISNLLYHELVADGRQGACIDISMVLSRILENEGIWNYIVKGALRINLPTECNVPDLFLWPIDKGEFQAGHAWLIAPPFGVVDISLKSQPYPYDVIEYLPDTIHVNDFDYPRVDEDELFSPEAQAFFKRKGITKDLLVAQVLPYLNPFWTVFPPVEFSMAQVRLKYIPTGISASEDPLEEIKSLQLSGKTGIEIYLDIIKPQL
jgi:hypothetical protein